MSEIFYTPYTELPFDPPVETGMADSDGTPIRLGGRVELVCNEGTSREHKGCFKVIWDCGGFCLQNGINTFSIRAVGRSVRVV